jgi:hypothetical protein
MATWATKMRRIDRTQPLKTETIHSNSKELAKMRPNHNSSNTANNKLLRIVNNRRDTMEHVPRGSSSTTSFKRRSLD